MCEAHFVQQYYSLEALWMAELSGGALKRKNTLLTGSVQTVQLHCHAVGGQQKRPGSAQGATHQHKVKRSRASAKLEIAQVRKYTLHDTSLALC